ncbi:MAG TPA: UvrD-helicase domain-containing protein [Patescibacteria group bacterium]|jgi:DNA helicase-2/ATP-dependent DNA helicase PcrA|nr:UvrD-helicase domain-containing protein [Patescibacteria group bacterium]
MDLNILNDRQKQAVTAPLGPVLVLAGAGSGKTRVLTYRIAYLIEQGMVQANNILAVTFTNKAAKEMQTRVNKLILDGNGTGTSKLVEGQPILGTFHSIGARLLRQQISRLGYSPSFTILDSEDQLKVIRDICKDLDIPKQYAPTLFRAYISSAKNLLQTPDQLNVGLDGYIHDLVQQVYVRYQNFIYKQSSVDFDDLLMLPIKLFEAFPEVLRKYQTLWQYILVDEYQDTNQAQYMFLHMLAKHRNLFVVGDDAQSIYGFRGSNIGNILNFEKDFADSLVVKLEQNYRSSKNILAAAQKVIELNSEQKPKTLWTDNEHGNKVVVEEVFDGRAEAVYVAQKIVDMASGAAGITGGTGGELTYEVDDDFAEHEDFEEAKPFSILDQFLAKQRAGGKYGARGNYGSGAGSRFGVGVPQLPTDHAPLNEFAILYRTHAQSRQMEEVLIQAGIPYQIVGGVKFYERKEIKDVLAYVRLIVNPQDLVSLARVVNVPARGIGEKSFATIKNYIFDRPANESRESFFSSLNNIPLPPKQLQSLINFYDSIAVATSLRPDAPLTDLFHVIIKTTKMEEYLKDGTDMGEARIENVKELSSVAAKFDSMPWQEGVQEFLEEVALITDIDNIENEKDSVTLMTLHAAKGLEFDVVFFIGLEEGLLPHSQTLMDPKELAEEIRLAYVGLTRARKQLYLLYAQSRQMYGSFQSNPPSRVLRALPQEAISLRGNAANLFSGDGISYEVFNE